MKRNSKPCLLFTLICSLPLMVSAQRTGYEKKFFFTANGGIFAGGDFGYTIGIAAGIRTNSIFSFAIGFQKTIPDETLIKGEQTYDRLDCRMYSIKALMNVLDRIQSNSYVIFGAGYNSTPHTKGKDKTGAAGYHFNYHEGYFLNPGFGMEFPLGRKTFYFVEMNYYINKWASPKDDIPGLEPRKYAHIFFFTMGIKL